MSSKFDFDAELFDILTRPHSEKSNEQIQFAAILVCGPDKSLHRIHSAIAIQDGYQCGRNPTNFHGSFFGPVIQRRILDNVARRHQ
jgi:hypothetical protein